MNKETLIKHGVQHAFQGNMPQLPGANPNPSFQGTIMSQTSTQNQERKWWRFKKEDATSILTPHEQKVLKKVKKRARLLDQGFGCCCCHIGLDPIIGIIPIFGDLFGVVLAMSVIHMALEADIPESVYSKMLFNVMFDMVAGFIPILGDIMDFMYKCNTRNANLLEQYLLERRQNELNYMAHNPLYTQEMVPYPVAAARHGSSA